jgi:hypothetical protein
MVDHNHAQCVLVLGRARLALNTAKRGLADMKAGPERHNSGLRNAVVFGRTVTFVLQNLSSRDEKFDAWYQPHVAQMRSDPLMQYFKDLRNRIEKQGDDRARVAGGVIKFSSSDLEKLGSGPPGAKGFFIGDKAGGSSWRVEVEPGVFEPFYVTLPAGIANVWVVLEGAPKELGKDATQLCEQYVAKLERLVVDAENEFGKKPARSR